MSTAHVISITESQEIMENSEDFFDFAPPNNTAQQQQQQQDRIFSSDNNENSANSTEISIENHQNFLPMALSLSNQSATASG